VRAEQLIVWRNERDNSPDGCLGMQEVPDRWYDVLRRLLSLDTGIPIDELPPYDVEMEEETL
jgi:hypothetical protein